MTYNTPSSMKKHRKSTEPESHQTAKMFFLSSSSSDGLAQNCVTLSRWFHTKQQHFTLSSAPAHHFSTIFGSLTRRFKPVTKQLSLN